jgi:hypothetical protein
MNELFEIEESLSPRMKWIRAMGVVAQPSLTRPNLWCASIQGTCAFSWGDTESKAIENLADKLGVVNWEVKP